MNDQLEKMEISISSSSSSSISSMTSNTCQQQPQSDIETILELVEALDLNPELFEKSEINKTHLTKDYIIKYLKNYLDLHKSKLDQEEQDENNETEDNNTIKLNELKTALLIQDDETDDESNFKLISQDENLPRNLLVTSMQNEIFTNKEIKSQFEKLFNDFKCKFCYLSSFKRCYIQFNNPVVAILARIQLHEQLFLNEPLKIFLNKPIKLKNTRKYLEAPQSDKLFLISPPASPPVGWEQEFEEPPVVNLDLLAAISQMKPNEPCEIVKSKDNLPSIVIHPCPDLAEPMDSNLKRKFMPTRRPANDFN